MVELPPLDIAQIINVIYAIYYFIRDLLSKMFEYTIFQGRPEIALLYGDAITILISLTAVYLILELFTAAKKFIRWIILIGWGLLIISIIAGAATL